VKKKFGRRKGKRDSIKEILVEETIKAAVPQGGEGRIQGPFNSIKRKTDQFEMGYRTAGRVRKFKMQADREGVVRKLDTRSFQVATHAKPRGGGEIPQKKKKKRRTTIDAKP